MEETIETEPFPSLIRPSSPSPSIPPTPAISSCPSPDRTFSSVSSLSTSSATSNDARSTSSGSSRRRGYIRPQGAEFAESAKHRESVLSLGSIAHLQYYFARTGLLDGKGGHAREYQKKKKPDNVPRLLLTPNARFIDEDLSESPTEEVLDPAVLDENDEVMLPPTVSTYSMKTHHIPPPPDLMTLRKDLLDAVEKAEKSIELAESEEEPAPDAKPPRISLSPDDSPEGEDSTRRQVPVANTRQSWDEVQGMHILDVVTLAIRAAKIYYTAHPRPERLASVKSEREIRQALFHVLEVLKRWASRKFAGGLREDERASIMGWMSDVRATLAHEGRLEANEAKEREDWIWASGDWAGKELEREENFLRSLMAPTATLPAWTSTEDSPLPTPFLERLRDGRVLVQIHNNAVKKSKRPFCEITAYHEDVAKPYRRAENLRYWVKAAEIRWETKLEFDVMGVVHGSSDEAWKQFDMALRIWCKAVREELVQDWWETKPINPPTEDLGA
ncbi:hypothetical protein PHISCL_09666 [Aspergillus sclerotialis]|uniref:Uncharacterized protein n=1 Tax=Aspergillus sclerotialis TaxID=2070753 RepID=A0A3A2Z5A6_9EURO|nr:hypothetical protein PHISCL_09666 [Aspergillus sclerotialis]